MVWPLAITIGMIGIVIRFKWKLRRHTWFWTTIGSERKRAAGSQKVGFGASAAPDGSRTVIAVLHVLGFCLLHGRQGDSRIRESIGIEDRTEAEIKLLLGEWRHGFEITSRGGTFGHYRAATQTLRRDPFMVFLSGGKDEDEAAFLAQQKQFLSGKFQVDEATGLMIYVPTPADFAR